MKKALIGSFCAVIFSTSLWGAISQDQGVFSGRVSKINVAGSLVRVKLEFENFKYLNKNDRVEFWHEHAPNFRCTSFVVGKSSDYLLLKIPEFEFCMSFVPLANGLYLHFFSQDLVNNLKMGRELLDILLKKKLAISGEYIRTQKNVDTYINKVSATNERYKTLRDKLETEWKQAISDIEEDQAEDLKRLKNLEVDLDNINFKLERYRIHDSNLKTDRWALDPRLYYKK